MTAVENEVSKRIQKAMDTVNITQSKLAKLVGATQPAVSQWLSGDKNPTDDNLKTIAKVLGVRPEWLKNGDGPIKKVDADAERKAYQAETLWAFRTAPPDGGRDYGNANVWSFDPGLDVLDREVLQNALDAAKSTGHKVKVVFRIIRLAGDDLRSYQQALRWDELRAHLEASTTNGQKLGTLIRDGLKKIDEDKELLLLTIEDSGTTGLIGPEKEPGKFTALCRNNLDSNKEGAVTKGGAFGLGKAVLWRASRLSTVLFCSHLDKPENGKSQFRILGRCDLPWHASGAKKFAGPGWFGRRGETLDDAVSFWGNQTLASDLYLDRDGNGTTACVVGFHDASADQDAKPEELARELVNSSARWFFPALAFGLLEVHVEVYQNRQQYVDGRPGFSQEVNVDVLQPNYCKMLKAYHDGTTAEGLGDGGEVVAKPVNLDVPKRTVDKKHGEFEHAAVLLVMAGDEEASDAVNRLDLFRGPGMIVESMSLAGLCLGSRPFHALLLCGKAPKLASDALERDAEADGAAEEFLRTAEPPSHNKWMATPDLKSVYARGCKTKLEDFLKRVKEAVRDLIKPAAKDFGDGPQSLKELFRIGSEPVTKDRPRVTVDSYCVDGHGRWQIKARVRLKARDSTLRVTPSLFFLAETGGGKAVKWESIEAILNCEADGADLLIPPNTREARFSGLTNSSSHPVPASQSCAVVDVRKVIEVKGGKR